MPRRDGRLWYPHMCGCDLLVDRLEGHRTLSEAKTPDCLQYRRSNPIIAVQGYVPDWAVPGAWSSRLGRVRERGQITAKTSVMPSRRAPKVPVKVDTTVQRLESLFAIHTEF